MIATIEARSGLVLDRYTVETDAVGIRIEHEQLDASGRAELSGMATLLITPEAAGEVLRALQRAVGEGRL